MTSSPDKKSTITIENALMKAQDELVGVFSHSLAEIQISMQNYADKCAQVQVELGARTQKGTSLGG